MIRSMTGYGRGESMGYDWKCTVELKAVNHRYCDISIRIPPMMNPFEDRIRKILAKEIGRGKVDMYVRIDSFGQQMAKVEINTGMADAYMKALHKLLERYAVPDQATLAMLASYPDVFVVDKSVTEEARNRIWAVLERSIQEAVAEFNSMRLAEGKALHLDILTKRTHLIDLLREIKAKTPEIAKDYEKRLRTRVDEVLKQIQGAEPDESRLLVELAIFTERACVDEEIIRIESHLRQLDSIMAEEEAMGRKLDFLVQELHREVNTIGSKTANATISKLVIDMKSEIEKIREQVQNVE